MVRTVSLLDALIDIVDIAVVNECFAVGLLLDVYVIAGCKSQVEKNENRRNKASYSLP